jgi:NAD(P)-dependent dehydrogenase (short-subunit alcohol dehydrogenase family)
MLTGATGGIGQALTAALAAAGHKITVVGRNLYRLHVPGLRAITADLSQPQSLAHAVPEPERMDALVHCAGISIDAIAPVASTGLAAWRDRVPSR